MLFLKLATVWWMKCIPSRTARAFINKLKTKERIKSWLVQNQQNLLPSIQLIPHFLNKEDSKRTQTQSGAESSSNSSFRLCNLHLQRANAQVKYWMWSARLSIPSRPDVYCKRSMDGGNIWDRWSMTGLWFINDCCWVTPSPTPPLLAGSSVFTETEGAVHSCCCHLVLFSLSLLTDRALDYFLSWDAKEGF